MSVCVSGGTKHKRWLGFKAPSRMAWTKTDKMADRRGTTRWSMRVDSGSFFFKFIFIRENKVEQWYGHTLHSPLSHVSVCSRLKECVCVCVCVCVCET